MKVATTRAELRKIKHKSIQVVAEGIGLENYLIRNVAALHNFQCNVCLRKFEHFAVTHSLNFYQASINIPEHSVKSRNIPEHEKIIIIIKKT